MLAIGLAIAFLAGCRGAPTARWTPEAYYAAYDHYRIRGAPGGVFRDGRMPLVARGWHPVVDRLSEHDLEYEFGGDGADLWVDTIPLPPELEERELRFLLDDLVAEVGSRVAGYAAYRGLPRAGRPRVVAEGTATIGGNEAYVIVFDFGPGTGVAEIALVRASLDRRYRPREVGHPEGRPMLVLFGLVARPETFPLRQAELEGMLGRVDLRPDPE